MVGFGPDVCDGSGFVLSHQGSLPFLGLKVLSRISDIAIAHLLAGVTNLVVELKNLILALRVCPFLPLGRCFACGDLQ